MAGSKSAINVPTITMTVSNSTSVNPRRRLGHARSPNSHQAD
jgi:hypothetical protein